ncbi:MAG: LptF/LptG family permease [Planctomycetota bacterium]
MIFPRRHDRYVFSAFWTAFGAVLVFFTVIVVVIHMSDRLARVVRYWQPLEDAGWNPLAVLAEYYATLVPFIWMQIVPLATVLAAAFALTRLTRHNELSPLVTAGVSTRRITLPLILSALVLGGFLFAVQELFVPAMSRRNMTLERLLNENEPGRITKLPHFQDPGGMRLSAAAFLPFDRRIEGALLTSRDAEGRPLAITWYPLLRWDDAGEHWVAERDGTVFPLTASEGTVLGRVVPASEPVPFYADIHLFEVSVLKEASLGLSTRETRRLLEAEPDDPRLQFLHHQLFARAFTPLAMLLLGLPFCFGLGRRSAIPGTVAVLAAGALFYATNFLASSLAGSGEFNAVVLAWLPAVQWGTIGLALWLTMES